MEEKQPLISVIVPVYNVENYLPQCLDSLKAQTWKNLEIILVDDGATDGCPAICDAAALHDARIRVIHQKNGGLSAARNAGLDIARGEWIGFVDSDDYIAPDMYETLYRAAAENNAPLAVCSYTYVDEAGKTLPRISPITKDEVLTREEALNRLTIQKNWYYITAWNRLYRLELFDTVRFPVGKIHEDEWTAHLFYWQCERVAVLKEPLYYYVQREGSIMRQESVKKHMDGVDGMLLRAEFAVEHNLIELAFASCSAALEHLLRCRKQRRRFSKEERLELAKREERAKRLILRLQQVPGRQKKKRVLELFRISPELYRVVIRTRGRLLWHMNANKRKQ